MAARKGSVYKIRPLGTLEQLKKKTESILASMQKEVDKIKLETEQNERILHSAIK